MFSSHVLRHVGDVAGQIKAHACNQPGQCRGGIEKEYKKPVEHTLPTNTGFPLHVLNRIRHE